MDNVHGSQNGSEPEMIGYNVEEIQSEVEKYCQENKITLPDEIDWQKLYKSKKIGFTTNEGRTFILEIDQKGLSPQRKIPDFQLWITEVGKERDRTVIVDLLLT